MCPSKELGLALTFLRTEYVFFPFLILFFFFLRLLELGDKEWETQACGYRMVFKKNGRSLSV